MNAFLEARSRLAGCEIRVWAMTQNRQFELVLVRCPDTNPQPWIVYCFDTMTGDFYHPIHSGDYETAKLAFDSQLELYGPCDA